MNSNWTKKLSCQQRKVQEYAQFDQCPQETRCLKHEKLFGIFSVTRKDKEYRLAVSTFHHCFRFKQIRGISPCSFNQKIGTSAANKKLFSNQSDDDVRGHMLNATSLLSLQEVEILQTFKAVFGSWIWWGKRKWKRKS